MRKLMIIAASVAALAAPTAALAAAPNGEFNFKKDHSSIYNENASVIGGLSSQITQNGQFVSDGAYDQTTYPGSRADIVQGLLGH